MFVSRKKIQEIENEISELKQFQRDVYRILKLETEYKNNSFWGSFQIESKRLDLMDKFLNAKIKTIPEKTVYAKSK